MTEIIDHETGEVLPAKSEVPAPAQPPGIPTPYNSAETGQIGTGEKIMIEAETTVTPMVYKAIVNVTDTISRVGVAKSRNNQQQGYKFRGIDDIYNALAPELAKHKLCILPDVLERSLEERTTAKGNAIFYVTVRVRFDFVSAEDGSKHEVVTMGEAMDTADKATNKAMSAAYKYAAMMVFCIPTVGEDSENETNATRPSR